MRDRFESMEPHRIRHPELGLGDSHNGCFVLVFDEADPNARMTVIASRDKDWEHVSVSLPHRTPTWNEMDLVKNAFWREDETVMQLHVPRDEHVNFHRYCLHLWRPRRGKPIPRPQSWRVGPKKP